MNNVLHEQLNQLRVISLFREGNKARLEHGFLTIDDNSWISWVRRQQWMRPWVSDVNSKEETVKYLQDFYISINQSVEQLILEITHGKDQVKVEKAINTALSLSEKIKTSFDGLENLAKTYKHFPKQNAEIRGIIDDYAKPALQLLLGHIPNDRIPQTDEL